MPEYTAEERIMLGSAAGLERIGGSIRDILAVNAYLQAIIGRLRALWISTHELKIVLNGGSPNLVGPEIYLPWVNPSDHTPNVGGPNIDTPQAPIYGGPTPSPYPYPPPGVSGGSH